MKCQLILCGMIHLIATTMTATSAASMQGVNHGKLSMAHSSDGSSEGMVLLTAENPLPAIMRVSSFGGIMRPSNGRWWDQALEELSEEVLVLQGPGVIDLTLTLSEKECGMETMTIHTVYREDRCLNDCLDYMSFEEGSLDE